MNLASSSKWLYEKVENPSKVELELHISDLKSDNVSGGGGGGDLMLLGNFSSVGSYNWSKESRPGRPVVIIPGRADALKSELKPSQLSKSQYEQFVDENRFYQPDYPLETLFRAVNVCSPEFSFGRVQFVTDRNNLRKLLNFVEGKADEPFRIDFQRVGNMVVFLRRDERASMRCDDYGKDFERKFTESGLNQGAYRRIVSYKFGEFNMLVRFEVDCVERDRPKQSTKSTAASSDNQVDSLVNLMSKVSINLDAATKKKFDDNDQLSYIEHGEFDKYEKLVELTTKSTHRGVMAFPEHKWNQLFFSQTDALVIGWHSRGLLQRIEKLSFDQVTQRSNRTVANTRSSLGKLHDLLGRIRKLAFSDTAAESLVYSIIFEKTGYESTLKIFKCANHIGVLPKSLRSSLLKEEQLNKDTK